MPTGYTDELMRKGMPFDKFVLSCARAFAPCIELKDGKIAAAPRNIDDKYHAKELKKLKSKLKCFLKMSTEDQKKLMLADNQMSINNAKKSLEERTTQNDRLREMKAKVLEWTPPTKDHLGLKNFMLNQIETSFEDTSYYVDMIVNLENKSSEDMIQGHIDDLEWDIDYHETQAYKEEIKEENDGKWLEDLYVSLGK